MTRSRRRGEPPPGRTDREEVDGRPHTRVGAFGYSHEKGENLFVGALRFRGENLVLGRKVANFVEVYGRTRPVADIPKVTVTFGPPVASGEAVASPTADAVHPKGVPDYADAHAKDGALVATVGEPVKGRTKRSVTALRYAIEKFPPDRRRAYLARGEPTNTGAADGR
jgi:hypothetical protein